MRHLQIPLLMLALIVLPACSLFGDDGAGEIRLTNAVDQTVYFVAVEVELSHRIDLLPSFYPDSTDTFPAVASGATALVSSIGGYEPGDDVRFFLYAVPQGEEDGRAVSVRMLTVTDEALRRSGGEVVVEEL